LIIIDSLEKILSDSQLVIGKLYVRMTVHLWLVNKSETN